jgi:Tfp pilus assembly protein PilE
MINKKGEQMLLSKFASILLAILGIVLLFYFAFMIYSAAHQRTEGRQAMATLEEIALRFESLKEGQKTDYLYLAPNKYYFKVADSLNKIDKCFDEYCLCLCNKPLCSDFNICRKMNKQPYLVGLSDINMKTPQTIFLTNDGGSYKITNN